MKLLGRIRSSIVGRYKQWTFRPYVIERHTVGARFPFLIGDLFGEGWYGPQHEPWPELEWIKANGIRTGDFVVDCGANHGFSTLLFSRWAGPTGRVLAIEPLPHNASILHENLRLNGINNVKCCCSAAGATPGKATITTHPNGTIISSSVVIRQRTVEIPVTTLDNEVKGEAVNFLKVDVEGFELEVLKGARRVLANKPRLALELHVFMYTDKAAQLGEIFDIIRLPHYESYIQTEVDGPIRRYDPELDSVEALARCQNIHLFCR